MASDPGLTTLLELDGEILDQGNGYWVEIRAWSVVPTRDIPFRDAHQLLKDFFAEVDRVLKARQEN